MAPPHLYASWPTLARRLWRGHRWLLGGALVLGLLPYAALTWFVQPFWDDYGQAALVQQLGLAGAQRYQYLHWTGRYASTALLTAANPLSYGWMAGLRWAAVAVLAGTGLALAVAVRTLAGVGWGRALAAGAALLLALLYTLPSVYAAFYWFASFAIYQVGLLLLLALLLASYRATMATRPLARVGWWALAAASVAALAGASELTLLLTGWLLAGLAAVGYRRAGWPGARPWLMLLAGAAAGAAVLLAAPGNAARLAADAPTVAPAWYLVLARAGAQTLVFLTEPKQLTAMLVLPLLLAPLGYRARQRHPAGPRLPLRWGLALLLGGVAGCMLLLSGVAWGYPAPRILNLLWQWTLLGWLLVLWLAQPPGLPAAWLRRVRRPVLLWAGLLALGGSRAAWLDLLANARPWQQQQLARQAALATAGSARQLTLPPVRGIHPHGVLVLGETLDTAAAARPNQDVAAYYGLDSVRVARPALPLLSVQE